MLALSIRQPYAELILRGIKTVELRSRSTRIIDKPFWIYASKVRAPAIWSEDLSIARPPAWLIELAKQMRMIEPHTILPTGVIVGRASIDRVIPPNGDGDLYRWVLKDVARLKSPRTPKRQPQPMWFRPF